MQRTNFKKSESGNVLFLILIAVALFAALSYVVTQSTRSGGGSTEKEKNILSSAQMTQYPTALRTAIIRMILGGLAIENIMFNAPGAFSDISTNALVFHPQGGGANYQEAPADLSPSGTTPIAWYYNAKFRVPGIGIDTDGIGNDLIAFLPGISAGICAQVNDQLGIIIAPPCEGSSDLTNGVPEAPAAVTAANIASSQTKANAAAVFTFPTTGVAIAGTGSCATIFDRKASGCFYDIAGAKYVYYSVLLER